MKYYWRITWVAFVAALTVAVLVRGLMHIGEHGIFYYMIDQ